MDHNEQLKLQALLDGELPVREAGQVAEWAAKDREAGALLEEMRNTREALAGFETGIQLPESREFFWSKVEREILRFETPAPKPTRAPLFTVLRRFLVPASAVLVVLAATLMVIRPAGPFGGTVGAEIETALPDSGAFTYRDYSAGTTLVWLTYPAENEDAYSDEIGTVE